VNGEAVKDAEAAVSAGDLQDGAITLRFGKKKLHRFVVAG
jgi:hypothetical protein